MQTYKALIIDLDGTTVPNRKHSGPSQRVITAVHNAQKKIAVCVATGRPLHHASGILDILNITSPVILLGGAQIIDGKSRKFIYKRPLEKQDIDPIFTIITPYTSQIMIDQDETAVHYSPPHKFRHVPFSILVLDVTEKIADEMTDKLSQIPTVTSHKIVSWEKGLFCLNISHTYATKQHAVLRVAQEMNIDPVEMIGIGEGPNDFPLLMACGFKVAMGNAVEDLKAIADYVAPSVDEDGVADVIEKFILKT